MCLIFLIEGSGGKKLWLVWQRLIFVLYDCSDGSETNFLSSYLFLLLLPTTTIPAAKVGRRLVLVKSIIKPPIFRPWTTLSTPWFPDRRVPKRPETSPSVTHASCRSPPTRFPRRSVNFASGVASSVSGRGRGGVSSPGEPFSPFGSGPGGCGWRGGGGRSFGFGTA